MSKAMKSRRNFLRASLFAGAIVSSSTASIFISDTPLQILKVVQQDLFPKEKIDDSNAYAYLSIVLNHSCISEEDKNFLKNGTKWIDEEALTRYNKTYTELSPNTRQKILYIISKESWGNSWIKTVLTYIMEATLGDPIYGINKNQTGWKWLEHESGLPRPKEPLL